MSRLIFVTTELYPETPGGAGVLVDSIARRLGDHRAVTVLLGTPEPAPTASHGSVEVVTSTIPATGFLERSEAVARVLADLTVPGDRVEFHDFEGIGFYALAHRAELGLERVSLTIRFHGPYDMLAEGMDTRQSDWDLPAAMERESFRMADQVLIPVIGHLDSLIERYGVEPDRVLVAPPPVDPLPAVARAIGSRPVFAVVGRLAEVKGSQDMVAAALHLLDRGQKFEIRFVGGDGWSPTTGTTMQERLESMIPTRHRGAFAFAGSVDREQLPDALTDVTAVVVPSRFESFCLAAHEARTMGLPVIVPDLPAFAGLFDESTGASVYDGSVAGLAAAMEHFLADPGLTETLGSTSMPVVGDPAEPYSTDPEPRHPRSQAGLATAATQTIAALLDAGRRQPSRLLTMIRNLPDPIAKVFRLAPRSLKARVLEGVVWDDEATWRHRQNLARELRERLALVDKRIRSGAFPEVSEPDVTVVIPVHDDTRYMDQTLASVFEQTHTSWEVVIVDDGSTEQSALRYLRALRRPRVRVLTQDNRGLSAARNAGMREARGRFLVPLDSDDQLAPEFMTRMLEALESDPGAAYAHCYARLHDDVDAVWMTRPFNPYWQVLENGVVGCVLLRRQAWEQVGGYDESMTAGNEDWELWLRLFENGWGQVQVPDVLFKYRKHGISMSVRTEARFEESRRMVRERHPRLYERNQLAALKTLWYPMITAISNTSVEPGPDVETISHPSLIEGTWGKYVVDVSGFDPLPLELIMRMAARMEESSKARAVITGGSPPIMMVRRWALHDPESGHDEVIRLDDPTTGPDNPLPSKLLRDGWTVPPGVVEPGIPVQRQPPEESGFMPDPSQW